METHLRRRRGIQEPFSVSDAVAVLVKFREPINPNPSPHAPRRAPPRITNRRTSIGVEPSAIRTPISRVRSVTPLATTA